MNRETGAKSSSKVALPKVAIVGDDEDLHVFLKDLGELGHFQVIGSFTDAAQALRGLPRKHPDLVLIDIRLPDMSGIECTRKLKTVLPELAMVILTG
jgi:DNA-binding NarL/FixJ family response regulator